MTKNQMIQMLIDVLEDTKYLPDDIKAKSILAVQMEAGMLPPKAYIPEMGTFDYFWEIPDNGSNSGRN